MPYPNWMESEAYEEAMQELRALKWLEQQRRNGDIDEQIDFEGDDDEKE